MTIYPDWIKIKCPVCNARPYQPCEAIYTLPKGTSLRYPHQARLIAYEQTQSSEPTKQQEIRDSGEVLSPESISDRSEPNRTT